MPTDRRRFCLLVDDDELVCMVFSRAFAGQKEFLLDIAMTVKDALDKIAVAMYDVVFLDMRMDAGFNAGMDVLREIARLKIQARLTKFPGPNTFVVIMSGSIDFREVMQEANKLGAIAFVDKPSDFSVDFVRDIVNQIGLPLMPKHT